MQQKTKKWVPEREGSREGVIVERKKVAKNREIIGVDGGRCNRRGSK